MQPASPRPAAHQPTQPSRLVRPIRGRWIAGVCAGLADRFRLHRSLVRILFVLSCLLPGPQVLIYLALWIVVPSEA